MNQCRSMRVSDHLLLESRLVVFEQIQFHPI
jgi:hypothetical protein